MYNRIILFLFIFFVGLTKAFTQRTFLERENIGDAILFSISMGQHSPSGDLRDRFGTFSSLGTALEFLTHKTNISIGLEGNFFFGSRVKEDVLRNLRMPDGEIVGGDGVFSSVVLRQRGLYLGLQLGKLVSLSKKNPRTGLKVALSAGLLQHQIRIQDDSRQVNQVAGDYKKGYDRLTNGLSFSQFIGYQHLSVNRLANFYAGIECFQGLTQSRRDWNFDTMSADTEQRLDLIVGIRLGWVLPFYFGGSVADSYYY